MTRNKKIMLWVCLGLLLLIGAGIAGWTLRFRNYPPAAAMQDIRAGARARHAPRPFERYLELRYGPMNNPTNRQNAFSDFFNVGHIEALRLMVGHMTAAERQANIAATRQWIADYRKNMTPEEKRALGERFRSDAGRAQVQRASSQYLGQDVAYRAATAPVIVELMTTIAEVQKQ